MLNYIWLALVLGAVLLAGWNGQWKAVTDKSLDMAKVAVVDIALPLAGIMALWLGVMRLAERAGLVAALARALRPLLRRLFPDVPPDHPAMGSMVMNMAANILGLGNAATPLGLRAMKDLATLNPRPGTATNAMCTFLAINTGSIQLIPVTAIAVLAANNAAQPTAIIGTALVATACGAVTAVTMARLLERLPWFRLPPPPPGPAGGSGTTTAENGATGDAQSGCNAEGRNDSQAATAQSPDGDVPALAPLRGWAVGVLGLFLAVFGGACLRLTFPGLFGAAAGEATSGLFVRGVSAVSTLAIPFLLAGFPLYAALRGVKVYEEFVAGAKEGFAVAVRIMPYLVAILVAIGMFRAAGGIELLSRALSPAMQVLGFPTELLPLALMRPLSGSGTLGVFTELVQQHGPDSLIARMGGTIFGSTETTFYVLAVYFGSVGIRRTRHAVLAGLATDLVAVVVSVAVCRLVFG
mgnify:CR=1 FL=1